MTVQAAQGAVAAGRDLSGNAIGPNSTATTNIYLPPPRKKPSWPMRVGAPPLPASAFQPRPVLRSAIDRARSANDTSVLAQVLSGGGGVGKTQLAAVYAHEATLGGTDLVLWVPAGEVQQVITLYARAALLVQAPGADGADPERDAQVLLDWLATTERSWLVVLDDITDPATIARWWPPGRPRTGWVLATTRLKDARLTGQGRARVDVDVYTPAEAFSYLQTRLTADDAAHLLDGREHELADALGRLPLALGHAAAYILNQQLPCGSYLQRLQDSTRSLEDLLPLSADAEGYGRQVAAALLLSVAAAEAATPNGLARPVLLLAALLDPAGHPADIWATAPLLEELPRYCSPAIGGKESTGAVTAEETYEALLVLHRYGLITYDPRSQHQEVRIHALTARAARETTPGNQQSALAISAAYALLNIWPDLDQIQRDLGAVLRANSDTLRQYAGSHLWQSEARSLVFRAGSSLNDNGLVGPALTHWQTVTDQTEGILGPDHPHTLLAWSNLAVTYSRLSRYETSVELGKRALAGFERVLGSDHPNTLSARANLAATYRNLGRYEEALVLNKGVLADRERVLGPDHPDTLSARANLAVTFGNLDRYEEALLLKKRVLADRERVLGPDHPDTLTTRSNLAVTYNDVGRYDDALRLKKQVLADYELLLGPDHPDTLRAKINLAVTYSDLGRYDEAHRLGQPALVDCERLLGSDHSETLRARAHLAATYDALERHSDALQLGEQALADHERVLGQDHPETLRVRAQLALTYGLLGHHDKALQLRTEVLAGFDHCLGADHSETLRAKANLAATYYVLERHDEALQSGEEALAGLESLLGPDHPDNLRTRANLAATCNALGHHLKALQSWEPVLGGFERNLGSSHPETLRVRTHVAATLYLLGRHDEALQSGEEALVDHERALGPDHPATLQARALLAVICRELGHHAKAAKLEGDPSEPN